MSDTRQAGGYKATLSNPNVSDEAKRNAREHLEGDLKDAAQRAGQGSQEGKNPGNVAGGYKATLKNPNVSDEAKQHAKEQLDNM